MSVRMRPKRMASKLSTYWPPGDVLNFFPKLMEAVVHRLLPENRPRFLRGFLEEKRISPEEAHRTLKLFIEAIKLAHLDPDIHSLDVACARTGFSLCPQEAQAAVFMLMGELTAGIYIAGVKDSTPLGENGVRDDVETLVWAAEQHVQRLRE
jgi:hypothetical protein